MPTSRSAARPGPQQPRLQPERPNESQRRYSIRTCCGPGRAAPWCLLLITPREGEKVSRSNRSCPRSRPRLCANPLTQDRIQLVTENLETAFVPDNVIGLLHFLFDRKLSADALLD